MEPPGPLAGAMHRVRSAYPLGRAERRSLERLPWAGPEAVRHYQERRLRRLVRWAAVASPFYRRWFRESDVDPRDIRSLEDLPLLPLLDRSHLVGLSEEFCAYPRHTMWKARSTGTSGQLVTVYRTPGSSAFELAALERQWGWFGLGPEPRRVMLRHNPGSTEETAVVALPRAHLLQVSSYMLERTNLELVLSQIRDFGPEAFQGWPSSLTVLATLLRERGETIPVRAVITSSEALSPQQVSLFREVFLGPVVDHYGQSERVAMAGSCEAGGYHHFPDYGITELLPVPGQPDRYEIVGTPLHNWGFPLFRYRTGDTVSHPSSTVCSCGRTFPLLGSLEGRVEEIFTAADGHLIPSPVGLFRNVPGLRESQVAQLAPGRFEVRIVPEPHADLDAVRTKVLANADRYYGPGQTITFRTVDRLRVRPGVKFRRTVVEMESSAPPTPERA